MTKLWQGVLMMCALLLAVPAWSADNDYRMGTGDVLRITVYGQPDLTTEARVGDSGNISFPLIGDVKMAGITPAQGETEIAQRLSKGGFINEPFVTLNVVQYRGQQISVLGRVNRPGRHTLEKVSRVSDALALAGGIAGDGADTITLVRTRDGKPEYREIDVIALFKPGGEASNELVQDGDIINVSRQAMFYIYGEVQRPGAFRLEQNMSVVQALSMGGGVTPRGTQKGLKILRRDASGALQQLDAELADQRQRQHCHDQPEEPGPERGEAGTREPVQQQVDAGDNADPRHAFEQHPGEVAGELPVAGQFTEQRRRGQIACRPRAADRACGGNLGELGRCQDVSTVAAQCQTDVDRCGHRDRRGGSRRPGRPSPRSRGCGPWRRPSAARPARPGPPIRNAAAVASDLRYP